jgi:hypothetical protein
LSGVQHRVFGFRRFPHVVERHLVLVKPAVREADAGLEISDELIQFREVFAPNLAVNDLYHDTLHLPGMSRN